MTECCNDYNDGFANKVGFLGCWMSAVVFIVLQKQPAADEGRQLLLLQAKLERERAFLSPKAMYYLYKYCTS